MMAIAIQSTPSRDIQIWCTGCDTQITTAISREIKDLEALRLLAVKIHKKALEQTPTICVKPYFSIRIGA